MKISETEEFQTPSFFMFFAVKINSEYEQNKGGFQSDI